VSRVERGGVWGGPVAHSCVACRSTRCCQGRVEKPARVRGSVLEHRQRPAPAGELAGDSDVGDHWPLAAFGEAGPARVQAAVTALSGVAAGTCRGRCKVPPGPHHRTWSVTRPMVPGRLDEQPPDVDVTGLGDLALNPRHAGGGLGGHQPHERADGVAGEPMPATDLHCPRDRGRRPRRHPSRRTTGVNSLSAAITSIAASSRSRRALTASTAS